MERYSVTIEVIIPATQEEKAQAYAEYLTNIMLDAVLQNGHPFVEDVRVVSIDTTGE